MCLSVICYSLSRKKWSILYVFCDFQLKKEEAQKYKEEGNKVFKEKFYKDAIKYYSRALQNCPYSYVKERSIMYSNRAACKLHMVGSLHIYSHFCVLCMCKFLWSESLVFQNTSSCFNH